MIVMKETATPEEVEAVVEKIERAGARAHRSTGARVTVIGAIGDVEQDVSVEGLGLEGQPGVDRVVPILKPYKLASLQFTHGEHSVLDIEGRRIGGEHFALIAGPCTVETREQTLQTARIVRDAGASLFRGGAYKPRTSPYAFQGLGQEGLRLLAEAKAGDRPADRHRADGHPRPGRRARGRRRHPDRRAQHAELPAARGDRSCGASRPAQARARRAARRARDGGRVHPQGRQPRRDAVRAWHPHVRDRPSARHARSDGRADPQGAHAPAGRRRSQPRRRAGASWSGRCRSRPPRSAPTGSSSRPIRIPRRRSATVRRRCAPRASPSTPRPSNAPPRSPERRSAPPCDGRPADARRQRTAGRSAGAPLNSAERERPLHVAVLGIGLIGGSIGLAARARAGARVSGWDPDPDVRARALQLHAVDACEPDIAGAVTGADIVFVAAPVGALVQSARAALASAGPQAIVTRRRLDQARRRRGHIRSALRRRPSARRRSGLRRGARSRGPVRRSRLVPGRGRRSRSCARAADPQLRAPSRSRSTPSCTTG